MIHTNCLLIDVGSSFIKYGIFNDSTGKLIMTEQFPFPKPTLNDGIRFLVPAQDILEQIKAIFAKAQPYHCEKAFFSVQMHGYLLKDSFGTISDYVSWQDKSGDTTDARLHEINFQPLGTSLKNNLPLTKLAFRDLEGEFFTLGSYLAWALTGVNATHITDACPTGFYHAATGQCNDYCGKLTMPKAHLQEQALGTYQDVLIYTPIGDHQISYLGSNAGSDKYLINIGTATQICCVTGQEAFTAPTPNADSYTIKATLPGLYEQRPYLYPGQILHTITGLIGGALIYQGGQEEAFWEQLVLSLKKLPPKQEILLGGGGAPQIYEYLQRRLTQLAPPTKNDDPAFFALYNRKFRMIEENIGMEGLKTIAMENRLKAGTMLSEIAFANFPIIAKNSDLDFIIIDNEHGGFDYSTIAALVTNANLVKLETIVRIGDNSRSHITKLADMGSHSFLLPMTNTPEDIAEVVKYAKYSPIGKRGVSTTRAHTLYNPPKLTDYMKSANEKIKVYAQIETKSGVDNVREILAVEGMDGLFIGPNDLSVDLDCLGDKKPLFECIWKVAEAAREAGKPWGIITTDKELIAFSRELNVNCISCGSELNMLIHGCKQIRDMF